MSNIIPTRSLVRGERFKTDFRKAIRDINEAIQKSRLDSKSKFDKVSVLLPMWQNDDLRAEKLVKELQNVFARRYNYTTTFCKIPHAQGNDHVFDWTFDLLLDYKRKNDDSNNLTVIYYSGHGDCPAPYTKFHLFGNANAYNTGTCTTVDWLHVRGALGRTKGRLLLIFDCCYSASAALGGAADSQEIFAGSAMESASAASLDTSFTRHIIRLLNENISRGISIAEMNAIMVRDTVMTRLEHSPWHKLARDLPSLSFLRHNEEGYLLQQGLQRPPVSSGKVLISVALEGVAGKPDVEEFKRWLTTDIPGNVKDISVAAVFEVDSRLILLTIPTEVWSCLPDNPAMNFIAHVTSHNLLFDEKVQSRVRAEEPGG